VLCSSEQKAAKTICTSQAVAWRYASVGCEGQEAEEWRRDKILPYNGIKLVA